MKYLLNILFVCLSFFLMIGCSKNSTENTDFIDGQLIHPIQCKAINPSCDDRLEPGKSVQCKGITDANERCRIPTLSACGYCPRYHRDQAPPAGQCLNQTKNASGYCEEHNELSQ